MMSYSDSSCYETTYSLDERIGQYIQQRREDQMTAEELLEHERKNNFETFFNKNEDEIFHLPGLKFSCFTHKRVKLAFEPSKISRYVSRKVIFYCTIKYLKRYKTWMMKRDTLPVNYKLKVHRLFYDKENFTVGDEHLINIVTIIYKHLKTWTGIEEKFRLDKFKRYQSGKLEDIDLDTDDEELFLTEEEREQLFQKRQAILKRMLPPTKRVQSRRKQKRRIETQAK